MTMMMDSLQMEKILNGFVDGDVAISETDSPNISCGGGDAGGGVSCTEINQDLIEGIGNEVLLSSILLFAVILTTIFYVAKRYDNLSRFTYRIHPSNLTAVNETRQQQQQQQQQQAQQTTNDSSGDSRVANGASGNSSSTATIRVPSQRRFATMDGECPVCLNPFYLPIETNCGHLFCGQCIVIYWQHAQWHGGAMLCPVCRQQVNILLPCFNVNNIPARSQSPPPPPPTPPPSPRASVTFESFPASSGAPAAAPVPSAPSPPPSPPSDASTSEHAHSIIREINRYNRMFSGEPRPFFDYLYDLPTLLRHMSNDFFSFSGLMYMFRIRIVLCFVAAFMYLISPLDMIPEAVFGIFGLIDDIVVVLLLAIYVTIIYRRFLSTRWEAD